MTLGIDMTDLFNTGVRPQIDAWLLEESKKVRSYGEYWSASSADCGIMDSMPKHNTYPRTISTRNGDIEAIKITAKIRRSDFGYRNIVQFKCFCGNYFTAPDNTVSDKKGSRSSCGCITNYLKGIYRTKHGLSNTPEHRIWRGILDRCYNPNRPEYPRYGGRGIKMYSPWVKDFKQFYDHIGQRPTPQHSVERIDNSKGYEPNNVRWATKQEQQSNMRTNVWIEYGNRKVTASQLARELGVHRQTVYSWIKRGCLEEKINV